MEGAAVSSDPPDPHSLRRNLRVWAETNGWPRLPFKSGAASILAGEAAWTKALRAVPIGDLHAIWAAIGGEVA